MAPVKDILANTKDYKCCRFCKQINYVANTVCVNCKGNKFFDNGSASVEVELERSIQFARREFNVSGGLEIATTKEEDMAIQFCKLF